MSVLVAASSIRTCHGDGDATFRALLHGSCGAGPLVGGPPDLGVSVGHHDPVRPGSPPHVRAADLLERCLLEAVQAAGTACGPGRRVVVLVGTGLGLLGAIETDAAGPVCAADLDVDRVVRHVLPDVDEVIATTGACSAGGFVLGLGADLLELDEADTVVVAAADTSTVSMLAMIGRVGTTPTERVQPFDRDRRGVLLGDGAAAVVLVPDDGDRTDGAVGRLVATGLTCDARHPTAPDVEGITRAMREAHDRAGRRHTEIDLVVAHGTGTDLNDPVECAALQEVLGPEPQALVTAVKGAVGHTSGAAALVNLDVALRCLAQATVPAVTGLGTVLDAGQGLRLVRGAPVPATPSLVQIEAFGFGGVNAVSLVESAR